jgi:citrate synthase
VLYGLSEVARAKAAKTPEKDVTQAAAKLLEALNSQSSSEDPETWSAGALQLLSDYQTLKDTAKAKAHAQRMCYQPIDDGIRAKAFLYLAQSTDLKANPLEVMDYALVALSLGASNESIRKAAKGLAISTKEVWIKNPAIPEETKKELGRYLENR